MARRRGRLRGGGTIAWSTACRRAVIMRKGPAIRDTVCRLMPVVRPGTSKAIRVSARDCAASLLEISSPQPVFPAFLARVLGS